MAIIIFLVGLAAGMGVGVMLMGLASLAQSREEEIDQVSGRTPGRPGAPDSYFASISPEIKGVNLEI